MKGSLQFEGPNTAGSEGYSAGFGLIALPSVAEVDIKGELKSEVMKSTMTFSLQRYRKIACLYQVRI